MGSDVARLSHSVSPQPALDEPARTLPRLSELGASSSTRPSSSASLNVLLNPILDHNSLAAGQQQRDSRPTPTPRAWTAVNHPRASSILEPRAVSDYNQAPSQPEPQYQRQPSTGFVTHSRLPSSINQEQGQTQTPAKDTATSQPTHDEPSASANLSPLSSFEHLPVTVVWGSVARSRARSSKQRRQQHSSPLSIVAARPHPATPPSPAPSPELESPNNPSVAHYSAPQSSLTSGHQAPAPLSIPGSQQPSEFVHPSRIVRFSHQPNTMPMSPPPNPTAGAMQQSPIVVDPVPQHEVVSPSSPDVCTRCYSFYLQQFHAAMQKHEQQSHQLSLTRDSQEDYNRFLEAGRASVAGVRHQFESVRQMCPECVGKPPEDSVENVKVAFRAVIPIRALPPTCAPNGKRKLDPEHGLIDDESASKSRRVSPELASLALCESTPPPEPESRAGTAKFMLGDINDMFVGFYRPRPLDDVVPTGPLERTARSLGLATGKPSNVSARNDPAPKDWMNMFYDPVIDSEKMSESRQIAPGVAKENSR